LLEDGELQTLDLSLIKERAARWQAKFAQA
jgi:hypothetical protein